MGATKESWIKRKANGNGGAWNKGIKVPQTTGKNNSRFSRTTLVCLECSAHFTVKNYRKDVAKFCSKMCSEQNRNEGKYSRNYQIRRSAAYKAWRTLVFMRDDFTCQHCAVRGGSLHADHIQPFALFPELRFEVSNGRTLCVPCHKKTPTYGNSSLYRKQCVAVA